MRIALCMEDQETTRTPRWKASKKPLLELPAELSWVNPVLQQPWLDTWEHGYAKKQRANLLNLSRWYAYYVIQKLPKALDPKVGCFCKDNLHTLNIKRRWTICMFARTYPRMFRCARLSSYLNKGCRFFAGLPNSSFGVRLITYRIFSW